MDINNIILFSKYRFIIQNISIFYDKIMVHHKNIHCIRR